MRKKKILDILFGTGRPLTIIPGTLLGIAVMLAAQVASGHLGDLFKNRLNLSHSLVSMFLLAIIFGMAVRNIFRLPAFFEPGIQFCVKKLLRLGIIFLGIRLSLMAVAKIGAVSFIIAALCVTAGTLASHYLARWAGVELRLGTLIAAGTGICGISAIVAVSPCIDAREEETAYAISTITIFGLMVTLIYPYLVEMVFHFSPAQAGLFLGASIHDTSQVTCAAYIYDQLWSREVSRVAITTKLIRNMLMVAVIPVLAMVYSRRNGESCGTGPGNLWHYFPKFVLGFLAFALLRSLGDYVIRQGPGGFLFWSSGEAWAGFCLQVKTAARYILAIAISGAGLCTRLDKLKQLSFKPFLIGLAAAVIVGGVSFLLVTIFSGPIASIIASVS
jgi:uncharacterized integral membrane protein (TIGR00698 family)